MAANLIKEIVSRNKRRFQEDGFDLDLTCILFAAVRLAQSAVRESCVFRRLVPPLRRTEPELRRLRRAAGMFGPKRGSLRPLRGA